MTGRPHQLVRLLIVVLGAIAFHVGPGERAATAQTPTDVSDLRAQLDRRFDVLPLQDGVMLRPRTRINDLRSIEVHEGSIAIDGQTVTGAELRNRIGADADLVVRVSFLSLAQQRTLAGAEALADSAPVAAPPVVAPPTDPDDERGLRRERRGPFGRRGGPNSGDRVRFGGTITVNEGETVEGDVVVIGGFARVLGRVTGEVVVVGGSAELGPQADVTGDVVVVGGRLQRDPGARIGGEVEEVGVGPININPNISWPRWGWGPFWPGGNPFGSFFSLVATVVRVGILCLLTAIVLLVGGNYVERIRTLAAAEPVKSGAVGFLSQVLLVPALVVLAIVLIITIVGIPFLLLLPFAVLGLAVLALVGFTAVARELGQRVLGRWSDNTAGVFAATMAGVLLIVSPVLLGRLVSLGGGPLWLVSTPLSIVGFVVEYLAWTIGLGAVLFMMFNSRRVMATPPPLP